MSKEFSKEFSKLKLIKIIPSPLASKKYRAYFNDETYTDFGAKGYDDYTIHNNDLKKINYLKRHSKNEDWNNPKTAGALSRWILWNETTLQDSIKDYKKRFRI